LHFFLGSDEEAEDSGDESDDDVGSCLNKPKFVLTLYLADD
jgi:hypothetical protein